MLGAAKWVFLSATVVLMALQSRGQNEENYGARGNNVRQGKDLLDWIGLGTGPDTDPFLAKANVACLNGDLAECFKSRALSSLQEFFDQPHYSLTENARILRMPEIQLRQLAHESFEYSEAPRAEEPEWDQLVKFVLRKVEKFMKSTGIEIDFNNQITENGRYMPRFVDEISDEIDIIEDKKDTLFNRKQLKKIFIPLLIILKIFKLKLLLFLPLILGLASFKKLLGFFAIIVPGLIGFFKFCKPDLNASFGQNNYYNKPQYTSSGIGYHPYHYREGEYDTGAFRFGDNNAQNVAYGGYSHYRNTGSEVEAETTSKKSILPDS